MSSSSSRSTSGQFVNHPPYRPNAVVQTAMPSCDASPSGSPRNIRRVSATPNDEGAFAIAQPVCPAQSANGWNVFDAPRGAVATT